MKQPWERYSTKEHELMERMWADGASIKAIAKAVGRNDGSVGSYMHANRTNFPLRHVRTTSEEWEEMARLRMQGWSYKRIGDYLGVNEQTVRNHVYDGRNVRRKDDGTCAGT